MLSQKKPLRVALVPTFDPVEWTRHPRFGSQTLLLGSHENFRRVSQHLVAHAALPGAGLAALSHLFERWIAAMRSHEHYEEHKLYPYLERRWQVSFEAATAGHHALHERTDAVREAFSVAGDGKQDDTRRALADALIAHDRTLLEHLSLEERRVIPLLLELDPEEFQRLTTPSIHSLLRQLDGA